MDQLPSASRLNEAMQNDPDFARAIVERNNAQDDPPPWTPPLREWDLNATLLREIREALGGLAVLLGAKREQVKPFPTPRTEVDRAQRQADEDYADQIIAAATPKYARKR